MKHTLFLVPLLSALLLVGCEKSAEIDTSAKRSTLHLSLQDTPATKGSTASFDYETQVNSVDFLVFNDTGNLENKVRVTNTGSADFEVSYGQKQVFAGVNFPSDRFASVETIGDLKMPTQMTDNSANPSEGFVMGGIASVNVNSRTQSVSVPVERYAARVILESITNNLPAECGELKIDNIWLGNILNFDEVYSTTETQRSGLGKDYWLNKFNYPGLEIEYQNLDKPDEIERLMADFFNMKCFPLICKMPDEDYLFSVQTGATYATSQYLYTYTNLCNSNTQGGISLLEDFIQNYVLTNYGLDLNGSLTDSEQEILDSHLGEVYRAFFTAWEDRPTRLGIQASFIDENGDERSCFYPINITPIERNKSYTVRVTISKKGSQDPDVLDLQDLDFATAVSASITVSDWETGFTYVEDFQ